MICIFQCVCERLYLYYLYMCVISAINKKKKKSVFFKPHLVNMFSVLASSGIDYDVKLWSPTAESNMFDEEKAAEVRENLNVRSCCEI